MRLWTGDVAQLATGFGFTEGPCWIPGRDALLFTDIPGNTIQIWRPADNRAETLIGNAHFAIGLALSRHDEILCCEHTTRSLTARSTRDFRRRVLASGYGPHVLNSTNDVICASDGTILFTDPPFGVRYLDGALHGYQQAQELDGAWVFRVTDRTDRPEPLMTEIYRPNGLCLSPDEKILYVSDSSEMHHKVLAMDVAPDWSLSGLRDFAVMPMGVPDGMRVDIEGRLWVAGGDGVHVYAPDGAPVDHVPVPEMVTNVEFGGADLSELFITATRSLYRVRTKTRSGRAW
ncbi:SMP-30/gluconolactonase/LRE family protein [Boseongicola sp. H5]|uniref:SMP-30/gluconolactonase/LRE family protein n=1 Tax=Boseongicola sp. H5 TaxID=2763261 RepID=UPI001D0AA5BA|nr:SMP-30/gluconolactonase/LRE family protein [Boseongicola sp. H5]